MAEVLGLRSYHTQRVLNLRAPRAGKDWSGRDVCVWGGGGGGGAELAGISDATGALTPDPLLYRNF